MMHHDRVSSRYPHQSTPLEEIFHLVVLILSNSLQNRTYSQFITFSPEAMKKDRSDIGGVYPLRDGPVITVPGFPQDKLNPT